MTAVAVQHETLRHEPIERWIEEQKLDWNLIPSLALVDINLGKSHENQARLGPALMEETVEAYMDALQNGAQFPPIVVHKSGRRFIVIDGNQRVEAFLRLDRSEIPAYEVLKPSPNQVLKMTFEANTRHGVPTSKEERMAQALYLVERGATRVDAAKSLGLSKWAVTKGAKIVEAKQRLIRLSRGSYALPDTVAFRLNSLRSDVVFLEAVKLTSDADLTYDEVDDLVTEVNRRTTEAAQLEEIAERRKLFAVDIAQTAGGFMRYPLFARRVLTATGWILNTDLDVIDPDKLTPEARQRMLERCKEARKHLQSVENIVS